MWPAGKEGFHAHPAFRAGRPGRPGARGIDRRLLIRGGAVADRVSYRDRQPARERRCEPVGAAVRHASTERTGLPRGPG
jgi:hypothetical protein